MNLSISEPLNRIVEQSALVHVTERRNRAPAACVRVPGPTFIWIQAAANREAKLEGSSVIIPGCGDLRALIPIHIVLEVVSDPAFVDIATGKAVRPPHSGAPNANILFAVTGNCSLPNCADPVDSCALSKIERAA